MLMFNSGPARLSIAVENPVESSDDLGAPMITWAVYLSCRASIENEEVNVVDSAASGPRREASTTLTLSWRSNPNLSFSSRQRVRDVRTNALYAITAVRYNRDRTVVFADCVGGISDG